MDNVYLLNSPFSFQAMEKHAAYCAMIRLGLKIPETVLVPCQNPLDNIKYAYPSQRYDSRFDLDEVAGQLGYPLYLKPYDGGGWRGLSRIRNAHELEWATGPEFDRLITDTVAAAYPGNEHERFIAHFRGLTSLWARDEAARLVSSK